MDKKIKIEIVKYWLETQNFMKLPPHLGGKFTDEDLLKIFLEIRPSKIGNLDSSTLSNADLVEYMDKLQSILHKEAEISLTERQLKLLEEQKNIQMKQTEIIADQGRILNSTFVIYTFIAFTMLFQLVTNFFYYRKGMADFDQIFAGLFVILAAVVFSIFYNNVSKNLRLKWNARDKTAFIVVTIIFIIIIILYIFVIANTNKSPSAINKNISSNKNINVPNELTENKKINLTLSNISNSKKQNKSVISKINSTES